MKTIGVPGPGTYNFRGEFEFRDPNNPEDRNGKAPKFHFGNKLGTRAKNLDVPGVGNVDVDMPPMWMKNVSHVFGTSFRPELTNAGNLVFPGPGEYEISKPLGGAPISFGKELKSTTVEKTYAPGPASYAIYGTVGVIRDYLKNDANPRIPTIQARPEE